jgi:hypothetical protein
MNDEIPMTNDETNPNDQNHKCQGSIPSEARDLSTAR